jgi:integrase
MVDLGERRGIYSKAINQENSEPKTSALRELQDKNDRTHSREFSLSQREFENLIQVTYEMESPYDLECRFILFLAGKLGMRSGEITHLKEEWVDWSNNVIKIPSFERCEKGTNEGEVCGSCRLLIKKHLRKTNLTKREAKKAILYHYSDEELGHMTEDRMMEEITSLRSQVNETYSEVREQCWSPKTENGARKIPFDFDVRIEMLLESFFEEYSEWSKSKATVNRRVKRMKEQSDIEKRIFPHSLRATAASFHAARNISPHALMSIMGWSDIGTARAYINANEEKAQKEIRGKYR